MSSKTPKAEAFLKRAGVQLSEKIEIALQIAFEEGRNTGAEVNVNREVYEAFMKVMTPRFQREGIIRTGEAWELAKSIAGYATLCNMMRHAMEDMEKEGTVEKIRRGVWIIQHKNKTDGKGKK
jgi:hypothetical protein